jgi:hypothetical protein
VRNAKGISLSSSLEESFEIANHKATAMFRKLIKDTMTRGMDKPSVLDTLTLYIFQLSKAIKLPEDIHITRDNTWTSERIPNGHHAINALVGGMPVDEYIEKLQKIPFDVCPLVALTFTCSRLDAEVEWIIRRTGRYMDGENKGMNVPRWATVEYP